MSFEKALEYGSKHLSSRVDFYPETPDSEKGLNYSIVVVLLNC